MMFGVEIVNSCLLFLVSQWLDACSIDRFATTESAHMATQYPWLNVTSWTNLFVGNQVF